ncbi:predicted protein [Naegleria gruberi]|uniref:Predicted protein n=1 Tax=Naegleria gruberi TaxID=5762 RepID=D2W4C4_NAEGR|nr:uncharacterized protein NAEGRDRAFT_76255 [Naegleria gruberi]EFC36075.1 predicted protein [Naegleria gruberi]|eukprot:XP_002668819.1 predicted protein [Naegleria gruberi strain NEG-M]
MNENESSFYYQKNHHTSSVEVVVGGESTSPIEEEITTLQVPQRSIKHHSNLPIQPMKFVLISDTHCMHEMVDLPAGDVLLHCGDFTNTGLFTEVDTFFEYLIKQCDGVFKYIIMIVGNHEWSPDIIVYPRFQKYFREEKSKSTLKSQYYLLLDESVTIVDDNNHSIKIHGVRYRGNWAPPLFCKKTSFNIPNDIDILMTHFPCCKFNMDRTSNGSSRGSEELTTLLDSNHFTNLKVHCFGHNHCPKARGFAYEKESDRMYINAISVIGNKEDKLIGKPFVFEF